VVLDVVANFGAVAGGRQQLLGGAVVILGLFLLLGLAFVAFAEPSIKAIGERLLGCTPIFFRECGTRLRRS